MKTVQVEFTVTSLYKQMVNKNEMLRETIPSIDEICQ